MSTDRVSKNWQSLGIDTFSTPAILATLGHYGVAVDEGGYKKLAAVEFPFAIAGQWTEMWKGTGQFTPFPASAAEELWRRLMPGEICPSDVGIAILQLCRDCGELLAKKKQPDTLEARFRVLESYLPKVPPAGDRREKFMSEVHWILGGAQEDFDGYAVELAQANYAELATKFAQIEEAYFPVREGLVLTMVKALTGNRAEAIETLKTIAADAKRDDFNRLGATSSLISLDELKVATGFLLAMCDKAEADKDLELASALIEQLNLILEKDPKIAEKQTMRTRILKMVKAVQPEGEEAP